MEMRGVMKRLPERHNNGSLWARVDGTAGAKPTCEGTCTRGVFRIDDTRGHEDAEYLMLLHYFFKQ